MAEKFICQVEGGGCLEAGLDNWRGWVRQVISCASGLVSMRRMPERISTLNSIWCIRMPESRCAAVFQHFYFQVPALQSALELGYFKQTFGVESVAMLTFAPAPVDGQRGNESGRCPELAVLTFTDSNALKIRSTCRGRMTAEGE